MADKHIADGEAGFQAVNSTPDVCKVGNAVVPFDCFQRLSSEKQYSTTVRARGFSVLNVGSVISGTQSNAGSGVMSGTSLGSGDCTILTGSATVRVEGKPVARHGSDVGMNNLNCLGKLQTLVAPPVVVVKDNTIPCNNPPVSSPYLEAFMQDRQDASNSLMEKLRQSLDTSKTINSADKWTKEQIDKLRPVPLQGEAGQTIYDRESGEEIPLEVYNTRNDINAGLLRAALGFGASSVSGIFSFANSIEQFLLQDPRIKVLDSLILAENIKLGNVCAEGIWKDTEEYWDKLSSAASKAWDYFQDKWDKASPGDKAEMAGLALAELATLPMPASKAGWVGKAGKVGKIAKADEIITLNKVEDVVKASKVSDADVISKTRDASKTDEVAKAKAESKKGKDGVKVLKPKKIKCFYPYEGGKFKRLSKDGQEKYLKEYREQLQRQQDAINKMTAQEFKDARDLFDRQKRHPGSKDAQNKFREKYENEMRDRIYEELRNEGVSVSDARKRATEQAKEAMSGLAALHEPDMGAGGAGNPNPVTVGDRAVNSAIGGSWQHGRISVIDDMAKDAIDKGAGGSKMNVQLEVCERK
ncbi:polymorphic toxin type 15 domain-containing protein [Enterobacter sp. GD03975]|uniref:polymorphic toxin type 15 domain-containing protein n=1 Tax=Enterobacter sp. GD03975 TaxID=2975412 RepID=UPI00244A8190|nr:polymorphic toxin type 15 domain-containing protein [Enterobacter sp. GD03975]MDH1125690.1 polymorphic toxin type 15 domain-containing protein [Enterobacter sp. GD03975]